MSKIDVTLTAGQTVEFYEPGDFLRLLKADSPVKIEFYRNGAEISEADGVTTGYAEKLRTGDFDRIRITSATTQAVSLVTRMGTDVFFDAPPTGAVTLSGEQSAFAQTVQTVTTTSAQLLAAKPNRRYLLIQNNDASGTIYVTLNGVTATAANGVQIGPGSSYEISGFAPNSAIMAIGNLASNANVIVVEG